jgi:uncharacterized membrane protein
MQDTRSLDVVVGRDELRPLRREAQTTDARISAIDRLRGLVIVLMVLDHTRDFFTHTRFSPTDLSHTYTALFFTRWITHYCAPTFVFLAGLSAGLLGQRLAPAALTRFLLTRGLWLIALEFTVVNFAWTFNFTYPMGLIMQVIWAIGASLCALAGLARLPRWAIIAVGVALVAGHNTLDSIAPERFGSWATLWKVLHVQGPAPFGLVVYPLLPWIGVIALGYACAPLYGQDASVRRRQLLAMGAAACCAFVAVRGLNHYGDPQPWAAQRTGWFSVLSFLNVSKYPPSLDYVLMTLGPALLGLAWLERAQGRLFDALCLVGRVPLFAYVVHLMLVHALAGLTALALGLGSGVLRNMFMFFPEHWGFGLPGVYFAWLIVLCLLYPACRWFARVKATRRRWWLAYL